MVSIDNEKRPFSCVIVEFLPKRYSQLSEDKTLAALFTSNAGLTANSMKACNVSFCLAWISLYYLAVLKGKGAANLCLSPCT